MKNSAQILQFIQHKPQFSKLSKYRCIKKIQSLFSPALQKMIKFAYIKNDILFFVLNHPGAKQEFDNNIQSIKSALKFIPPEECSDIYITNIKAFVTNKPTKDIQLFQANSQITYTERANGDFIIDTKEEKLKTLLESIQKIIKDKK